MLVRTVFLTAAMVALGGSFASAHSSSSGETDWATRHMQGKAMYESLEGVDRTTID